MLLDNPSYYDTQIYEFLPVSDQNKIKNLKLMLDIKNDEIVESGDLKYVNESEKLFSPSKYLNLIFFFTKKKYINIEKKI